LKRGRRSTGGPPSDGFVGVNVVRRVPPPSREAAWNRSYTLERIRSSQPDPFAALIPASLREGRAIPPPPTAQVSRRGAFPQSHFLVDTRTGEIKAASHDKRKLEVHRCKSKDDRRHFVISSGHGGVNNIRKYSKHEDC